MPLPTPINFLHLVNDYWTPSTQVRGREIFLDPPHHPRKLVYIFRVRLAPKPFWAERRGLDSLERRSIAARSAGGVVG